MHHYKMYVLAYKMYAKNFEIIFYTRHLCVAAILQYS